MKTFWKFAGLAALALLAGGCEKTDPNLVQGYVEGEFVHVAAPSQGQLESLAVERGAQVRLGAPLFTLDSVPEKAARDEAAGLLARARATLDDAKRGQRPTEIAALQAQLDEAKSSLVFSESQLARQTGLSGTKAMAAQDLDLARSQRDRDVQRVAQLTANLETARLGSREAQIAAAEQAVRAQQAVLEKAEWALAQKSQASPLDALVTDVVYRQGDWVAAGSPVIVLLPPARVKVRAFVPQQLVGRIQIGTKASVHVDGIAQPCEGRVNYIAPRAEYTPPVIYSQQMREKFVYLVELVFEPEVAAKLHPGQPVDVRFPMP